MAKISALRLTIFLLLSLCLPASVSSEEQEPHDYILAIARLYSPQYVIAPSEEVGGPYEGEMYFGGVYQVNVKIMRVVSGNFDIVPKRMRLIANSPKYFVTSAPKLLLVEKSKKFGYRIVSWTEITAKERRDVCLPEYILKSLVSRTMFTVPDSHGQLCEHNPDRHPG